MNGEPSERSSNGDAGNTDGLKPADALTGAWSISPASPADLFTSTAQPAAFRAADRPESSAVTGTRPAGRVARIRRGSVVGTALGQVAASLARLTVVALFIITFLAQPTQIPSGSMENTLLTGDLVLVNKQVFAKAGHWGWLLPYRTPHVGSLVVFHYPVDPNQLLVKRVVAVGGDRIHLLNNTLYRNGAPQLEPYAQYTDAARSPYRDRFPNLQEADPSAQAAWWVELRRSMRLGELPMPPDHYFVMGDNRNDSLDSRFWGLVTPASIVGEPLLTYLSVEREAGRPPRIRRERLFHVIR